MTKSCFALLAAVMLVAVVCSPACAEKHQVSLKSFPWCNPGDGICTVDREVTWSYAANGVDYEYLVDAQPPVGHPLYGQDPRIRQSVLNNTQYDIWTDWHCEIADGMNLRDVVVYKVGVTPNWIVEPYTDKCGFFAHLISTGEPGNPMAVNPGERLYVEFTYDVVPGQSASVAQYPTTWYPIPEPSSAVALLAGMAAMGLGAIRRMKK